MSAAEVLSPAEASAEQRVSSIASGLLQVLDERRITGRLPADVRVQVSRLRHAVKVATLAAEGWVYLLHFVDPATGAYRPLRGQGNRGQVAGHYWGWTTDLERRIVREHRNPKWTGPGRLVQVALAAGLSFELAYLEYPATLGRERRLKHQGGAARRCPLCRGTGGPLDPAAAVAAVAGGAR